MTSYERLGVPEAAVGAEAEKLYQTVMAAINEVKPEKANDFMEKCRVYGQCGAKETEAEATVFYQFVLTDIGQPFWQEHKINLVRLLPDPEKRKSLMEASGLIVKPKPGLMGSMFGLMGAAANAASEHMEKQRQEAEERRKVEEAAAAEAAEKRAAEMEKHREEAVAKAAEAEKAKWTPTYINDEQKSVAEIIEALEHNDLWKECADENAALQRCVQYAGGLCQPGERTVKGWHVKSLDQWGLQQPWVLVLCSMSFFKVTFDSNSGKVQ